MAVVTKTLKSTGGDYSSMVTWESTEQTDLVSAGDSHVLECYVGTTTTGNWQADGSLDENVTINAWTTGASNTITIKAADGEGHDGDPSAGFMLSFSAATADTLKIFSQSYVTISGIRIKSESSSFFGFYVTNTSTNINANNCIFVCTGSGRAWQPNTNCGLTVTSCLALVENGFYTTQGRASTTHYIYNCTFIASGTASRGISDTQYVTDIQNCAVIGFASEAIHGTPASISYCALDDSSVTGATITNDLVITDGTDFTAPSTGDYTPVDGGNLKGQGTTPVPSTDIKGVTWTTDDIGAYAYVSAGGVGGIRNPMGGPIQLRSPLGRQQ